MIRQFTFNLAVAVLIIAQTNLGAQKVDSLHARMSVTISSFRQGPDRYGEMRVLEEENIEYSTELVMKVGLPLNQIDDPSRHEGYWDNLFAVGGTSYEQYFNYAKSQEPVYTRISPLMVHKVNRRYGYRKCEGSKDPGPGQWGLINYWELSDQIRTQFVSAYFRPYEDPDLASLTSLKPTQYVLVIRGPTAIEERVKGSQIFTKSNQAFSGKECQLKETGPSSITSVIPVEDSFADWIPGEDQVTPPLVKADIIDNYLLNPKGVLSLSLIGKIFSKRSDSNDIYESSTTISITLSPEPFAAAEVRLDGCPELGVGELGIVTATGKPEGGTYRFWCEPEGMLTIQSDGSSSVVIKGASPGRGMLYAEYTEQEGNTAQASQQAVCVKIDSYNGGEAIPQIALFDIDGKKLPGVLKVPVTGEPSGIEELVDFIPADNTVITANGLENSVEIHGQHQGLTTLQAKTSCGNPVGPAIDVEVVNCDKETVEALERMRQQAVKNLQDAAEQLQKITGSKEFEKARDDLVSSTGQLLAKTGLTIITSGKTSGAVETASKIAEAGTAVSDMISSANLEEFYANAGKAASGELFDKAVYTKYGKEIGELWGKSLSAAIGVIEVYQAAKRFGENAGQILYHEDVQKSAMENWEKADRDYKRIERLRQICKGDKTEPQKKEEPKADQTPKPTDPTPPADPKPPVNPKPKTDPPPGQKPPTEQPTPEPGDEEPPISPPPPTSELWQVGLPYSPEDCGCGKTKDINVSSEGFSTLQAGIKNIGDCVEKFNNTSVGDYLDALNELSAVTDTLKTALGEDPAIFKVKAKEAKPKIDSLIQRTKSYDEAGKTFLKQFEKCPESVTTVMDVLKSALTVTVDSITTKY